MEIDYQMIINEFGQIIAVVTPIALAFGLAQWIFRFVLNAICGGYTNKLN